MVSSIEIFIFLECLAAFQQIVIHKNVNCVEEFMEETFVRINKMFVRG